MSRINIDQFLDDELAHLSSHRVHEKTLRKRSQHALLADKTVSTSLTDLGTDEAFSPTLGSSRHEREWIFTYLGPFYDNQYILDVVRRIKGGKEANVYVCQAHPSQPDEYIAAKLYRPRMMRNLRNDSRYRQNRTVLDEYGKAIHSGDTLRAVRKGSSYGKEVSHASWLQHEFTTLQVLFDAGVPVPAPIVCGDNTILMAYIGELDQPAPTLVETSLSKAEATRTFDILINAVEKMLECGRIHADLSAYNVLFWEGKPTIIDFPQAINPYTNPEAWDIFKRDVLRLCQYFDRYGIHTHANELAQSMWDKVGPHPEQADIAELLGLEPPDGEE
jgi:RIO kinase 1